MDNVKKDKRFAHIVSDPRFKKLPKSERKVKIDQRFKSMFNDKKFKLKYSVDKRGRPLNLTTNENLRRYYDLGSDEDEDSSEDDESEDEEEVEEAEKIENEDDASDDSDDSERHSEEEDVQRNSKSGKKGGGKKTVNDKGKKKPPSMKKTEEVTKTRESHKESDDGSDSEGEIPGVDSGIDFARGEGLLSSSSDEELDDDDEETGPDGFDHRWGEVDRDVEEVSESTSRLAVCNMDWDRIKAQDIFIMLNSFKPAGGVIMSVKIYPSEFGQARMAEENASGPRELRETSDTNAESAEGSKYHTEKLRQYQLNRLKYYYAVVECDTVETADKIYSQCDGTEYESSSTKLDLRFIPDDMEFDQTPASVCTDQPDRSVYKPSLFFNTALSQSKVELTWDETDRDRVQATQNIYSNNKKKQKEVVEEDLQAYLASSSDEEAPDYAAMLDVSESEDEEESDEDSKIEKYKLLLKDVETKESKKDEKDVQMEISWEPGLKEATEDLLKKKKPKDLTPWEGYLEKKKEKKKKKREEKAKKNKKTADPGGQEAEGTFDKDQSDEGGEVTQAFSDDDMPDDINLNDPFFAEELKQRKQKDKSSEKKDKKKKKKKKKETSLTEDDEEKKKREAELELLLMDQKDNKKHFSLKKLIEESDDKTKKKKKKKAVDKQKEDDFQINVSDTRFSAVYDSHHFNIDPSAPEFKKTKGTEAIISEKLKRRKQDPSNKKQNSAGKSVNNLSAVKSEGIKRKSESHPELEPVSKKSADQSTVSSASVTDTSLASLVQSVKMKTQQFQNKKKR